MPRIPSSVFRSIKYEIQKHSRSSVCNFSSHPTFPTRERCFVLGIETSCDDTGCAIVDNKGKIIGEALHSQQQVHLDFGGIIPPVAKKLHQEHIEKVVQDALKASHLNMDDIDAVAATVKPGLPLSLVVGMNYGKELCRKFAKPFIPVHHMEAHTLTIRMVQKVDFPFLVLLISGGHCLLAIAQAVDKYLLLGHSIDDAPGEALDKTARRLKLRNIPEFSKLSGGQAIEKASERGNLLAFAFPSPMSDYRNCDFSFAGLKNVVTRHILHEEAENDAFFCVGTEGDQLIPSVFDLCASFQFAIALHLCRRVQRAMEFVEQNDLLPLNNRTLVVSGGVACNRFIAKMLQVVCNEKSYQLAIPPPKLCTDNGIMIAWNGMERWLTNAGIVNDLDSVNIEAKCPLGKDIRDAVAEASIKCKWIKRKVFIAAIQ
ncbi:tRNA N6-adenosine threonylcarbamoyltransferase, mitochondrial-like isoform X1 [Schistocerca gregaria]|uniref:tRNA N6-adenosine threonylcarbamoyltransferase, mitochondrial-like isoform X1 n=1 Tax=Schistocerca gregaria TaxID=7010 RepID=UPI00211EED22|nr:tRNA N6-adenosine threonylcarbamoyltransferase, mitochondrial-like isoform X1 [Schistocerca gregaria]